MLSVPCLLFVFCLLVGLVTAADLYKSLERQSKKRCLQAYHWLLNFSKCPDMPRSKISKRLTRDWVENITRTRTMTLRRKTDLWRLRMVSSFGTFTPVLYNVRGFCSLWGSFGPDCECQGTGPYSNPRTNIFQKRQIYDRHGEVQTYHLVDPCFSRTHISLQEGLKAHEGGQHHTNPFDMFSSFFGGGRQYRCFSEHTWY